MNLSPLRTGTEEADTSRCSSARSASRLRRLLGWSLVAVACLATTREASGSEGSRPPPCDSFIYCYGELLHAVQMSHLFPDSKTFVDMKLRRGPNETMHSFQELAESANGTPTLAELEAFVDEHFEPAGSEFEEWTPRDWVPEPEFLSRIKDPSYRKWAADLNRLWKMLGKKMKEDVRDNPELYSIIYVPNAVIVPGGRFREFYYWDSYWIVRGLLLSQMHDTVKGMLENFLTMIEAHGHIPNGGRVYYTMRSQPPMFVPMVESYLESRDDADFLAKSLPAMEKEFDYWMSNHSVSVTKGGVNYTLYRYVEVSSGPRPESYREDYASASFFKTDDEKQEYFAELKAAAESGWDFSSRWFIQNGTNRGNLTNLKTKYIVPVDLNAILYWNADSLSRMFLKAGNEAKGLHYGKKATEIMEAVTKVLWNDDVGAWLDYNLADRRERNYFYPTNLAPLWTGCYDASNKEYLVGKVLKYVQGTGIMAHYLGGVPTTLYLTNEQWDLPNAWPPLQHMVVMGLYKTKDAWARELAYDIAERWIKSNYAAYNETGHMYEKYDATSVGGHGTGGEYDVQLGFGWTNGVVLDFLNLFGERLSSAADEFTSPERVDESTERRRHMSPPPPPPFEATSTSSDNLVAPLVITALIFVALFVGGNVW